MKARICGDRPSSEPGKYPNDIIPDGTVIEKENIWKLVRAGVADPADEECRIAAGMDDADIKLAKYRQRRLAAGIHYDDYDAYDQGLMIGYDGDGKWIPGSNAETNDPEAEYNGEDDDPDDYDDSDYEETQPETTEETDDE